MLQIGSSFLAKALITLSSMQLWQEKLDVRPLVTERSGGMPGDEGWQFGGDMVVRFWDQVDEAQPAGPAPSQGHAAPVQERQIILFFLQAEATVVLASSTLLQ